MVIAALAATQLTGCGGDDKDTAADTAAPVDTAGGGDTSDTSGGDTGGAETGDTSDTADTADAAQ